LIELKHFYYYHIKFIFRCHSTQHNDIQYNNTQHQEPQHIIHTA